MRSRRTRWATAFGAAAVVALVAALSAAGSQRPDVVTGTERVVTVTLTGWASSPAETAALRAVIAAFERQNRTIKVQYAPISGDYDAAMLSRFAARRPPDVFYVESLDFHDYLPALEPLGSYIRRTGFATSPFYGRLLNAFR